MKTLKPFISKVSLKGIESHYMDIREEILKYLHERKGTFLLYLVLNTILLSLNILNPYINGRYINILIEDADYVVMEST